MGHQFNITLRSGNSYTTPWGRKIRQGERLTLLAGDDRLTFFKSSSRFDVAVVDPDVEERKKARAKLQESTTPKKRKTARNAAAPSQLEATSPEPLEIETTTETARPNEPEDDLDELSRSKLATRARDLGLKVSRGDTKAALKERIRSLSAATTTNTSDEGSQ